MKESLSNSLIFTLVITFLFIFVILFAGSTAYTKAFKVKNRIISTIERHEDLVIKRGINNTTVQNEINSALKDAGYTIVMNNDQKCAEAMKKRFTSHFNNYEVVNKGSSSYRYCIAKFKGSSPKGGEYYAVITYMYFEIPLIGVRLEFPVYGETKLLGVYY